MAIRFVYFDLGKVLVNFDLDLMLRQMADVAQVEPAQAKAALFDDDLHQNFELGRLSVDQYHHGFRDRVGGRPDLAKLLWAGTHFFELNYDILPVISALTQTRFPIGVLSNTCATHWEFCLSRYCFLRECFDLTIPSHEAGMLKPHADIYRHAAQRAGVPPNEIFFTDDLAENIDGAQAAGWDAVQFTSAHQIAAALQARNVPMNL